MVCWLILFTDWSLNGISVVCVCVCVCIVNMFYSVVTSCWTVGVECVCVYVPSLCMYSVVGGFEVLSVSTGVESVSCPGFSLPVAVF